MSVNISSKQLALLVQVYIAPFKLKPDDHEKIKMLQELEKYNLVNSMFESFYITGSGIELVDYLGFKCNQWIKENIV